MLEGKKRHGSYWAVGLMALLMGCDPGAESQRPGVQVEVVSQVQQGSTITTTYTLSWPSNLSATGDVCRFGSTSLGHQAATNTRASGRLEETLSLTGLTGRRINSIRLSGTATTFRYDDVMLLTYNSHLIMASDRRVAEYSANTTSLGTSPILYSWSNILNKLIDNENIQPPWCSSGATTCSVPRTETTGSMDVRIPSFTAVDEAAYPLAPDTRAFTLVTMGDNDLTTDCRHGPVSLTVSVEHVQAPCIDATCGWSQDKAGRNCNHILAVNPAAQDGVYWIDPNGGSTLDAFRAYCDMRADGGWTRLEGAAWPTLFTSTTWQALNTSDPLNANYSILAQRDLFKLEDGCHALRVDVGSSGNWLGTPTYTTAWKQCHDPFTQTTDGSDYTHLSGNASTTCGGFNGLHHRQQAFSYTSDTDSLDSTNCWWMQVVPHTPYPNYTGYLHGYEGVGGSPHSWQTLWVRGPAIVTPTGPTCESQPSLCGTRPSAAALSCMDIKARNPSAPSGTYWLKSAGTAAPFQAYCEMRADGGWTRLEGIAWPSFFGAPSWKAFNTEAPTSTMYSILDRRALQADAAGCYTLRVDVGSSGNWLGTPTYTTTWKQCHDPFTQTTDGSDYTHLSGNASTTCGGFNGLHHRQQTFSYTSDTDSLDSTNCWWMQVVPHTPYPNYTGYLHGYEGVGGSPHSWQTLWVRGPTSVSPSGGPTCDSQFSLCGTQPSAAALSCMQIKTRNPSTPSGTYWLKPAGATTPFQAYCEMVSDGGGWTRLEGIAWPSLFGATSWQAFNTEAPTSAMYSILGSRALLADSAGCYTLRLTLGSSGTWQGPPSYTTVWKQCHDPFTQTTDGSDFTFISGQRPTTCGGFNGLHGRHRTFSYTTEVDTTDAIGCWWMQIVPHTQYPGYSGYLHGYGMGVHTWQALWVR